MTDLLVELGRNATARRLVSALGLPLPLPTVLRRGLDLLGIEVVERM